MSLAKATEKLAAAIADVPAHIDERLVEVNTRDVLEVLAAIRGQSIESPDPQKLADLDQGSKGAVGRSAYIQAESVRFLLSHFAAPAPEPGPGPAPVE